MADRGVVLQAVAAETLLAVLEAGEAVVVFRGGAEGLTGFDGHASGVGEGGAGKGTGSSFVSAAEVGPGIGGLARGGDEGCRRGG